MSQKIQDYLSFNDISDKLGFPITEKNYFKLPQVSEVGSFLVLPSAEEDSIFQLYVDAVLHSTGLFACIGDKNYNITKLSPFEAIARVNEVNTNVEIGYLYPPLETGTGYHPLVLRDFYLTKGIAKASPEFIEYVKNNSSYKV